MPDDVAVLNEIAEQEGVLEESTETPPDVEEIEPTPDVDWKLEYDKLTTEFKQSQEKLQPFLEIQQRLAEAQAQQVIDQLLGDGSTEGVEDGKAPKVTPEQREATSTLLRDGLRYRQEYQNIANDRLTAHALFHAAQVLGVKGTIGELQELASELLELGDPKLMERYQAILKKQRQGTVAQKRTSIDQTPSAPTQPGIASDWKVLERKVGDGTATDAEFNRYASMYAERRSAGI